MDIDVENINKNDKNTWRTIHEAIDESCFGWVKPFPKELLVHCKNNSHEPQNISS